MKKLLFLLITMATLNSMAQKTTPIYGDTVYVVKNLKVQGKTYIKDTALTNNTDKLLSIDAQGKLIMKDNTNTDSITVYGNYLYDHHKDTIYQWALPSPTLPIGNTNLGDSINRFDTIYVNTIIGNIKKYIFVPLTNDSVYVYTLTYNIIAPATAIGTLYVKLPPNVKDNTKVEVKFSKNVSNVYWQTLDGASVEGLNNPGLVLAGILITLTYDAATNAWY